MVGMKKEKILESWVGPGAARSRFDDDGRAMRRPLRVNRYGFVDTINLLAWLIREEDYYSSVKRRHALQSCGKETQAGGRTHRPDAGGGGVAAGGRRAEGDGEMRLRSGRKSGGGGGSSERCRKDVFLDVAKCNIRHQLQNGRALKISPAAHSAVPVTVNED